MVLNDWTISCLLFIVLPTLFGHLLIVLMSA